MSDQRASEFRGPIAESLLRLIRSDPDAGKAMLLRVVALASELGFTIEVDEPLLGIARESLPDAYVRLVAPSTSPVPGDPSLGGPVGNPQTFLEHVFMRMPDLAAMVDPPSNTVRPVYLDGSSAWMTVRDESDLNGGLGK